MTNRRRTVDAATCHFSLIPTTKSTESTTPTSSWAEYKKYGHRSSKQKCETYVIQSTDIPTLQWSLSISPHSLETSRNSYHPQDTEFPGVVARPIGSFKTSSDYHYQTMRCNVDLLKIIQVGLTLADEDGNFPQDVSTWQFNFHFSVKYVVLRLI